MENGYKTPTDLICGYFDCSKFGDLKISPTRTCTMFEIEYFLEDGKNTYLNGVSYPIRRGFVLLCYPGDVRNSDLPFQTRYVKFQAEGALADQLREAPRYFPIYQYSEILNLLDNIILLHSAHEKNNMLLQGKLLTYVALLLEQSKRPHDPDPSRHATIMHAREYIQANYAEPIKLRDIAKEVNLSPNYFHTLFSEICGKTPHDYLTEQRISAVKHLLLTTQLSLGEIAAQCGFQTQQYMTTVFKAMVKCSPNQFKIQSQTAYWI